MLSVQIRNYGEGVWRSLTSPVTLQAAQTIAGAAKTLKLGDQVQVVIAGAPTRSLDVRA